MASYCAQDEGTLLCQVRVALQDLRPAALPLPLSCGCLVAVTLARWLPACWSCLGALPLIYACAPLCRPCSRTGCPQPSGLSSKSPLPERTSLTIWSPLASVHHPLTSQRVTHSVATMFVCCLYSQREYTCPCRQKSVCLVYPCNHGPYNNVWEVAGA